jgi:hypothetical protein
MHRQKLSKTSELTNTTTNDTDGINPYNWWRNFHSENLGKR